MVRKLFRINPLGIKYYLTEVEPNMTKIETEKNHILVNHPLDELSQAWYYWQQDGKFIQHAFHMLNDEEREFILSGITPEEWKEIFKDEESDGESDQ